MQKGILGKKLGMTELFDEQGRAIPLTVIEAGPCVVVQKKTVQTDGYNALQVGFGEVKERNLNKPAKGHFSRVNVKPRRYLRELRLDQVEDYRVGQEIKADIFAAGDRVDVIGITKGKGFAGGVKRWGFGRGPMAHGSKYHRGPGSLQSRDAARVFKGRRMPGHLGQERVTVQNLKVFGVDPERNLLLVKGAVPGARGSLVVIKNTVKAG
ncbi:MAG: 50S ribosomal protein L3 [Firmicutes bacterium]|nr:50S ribosomal protein L3 [Bacillota bacterium]MCL5038564.1 50S ribosomal protein L3 [Bacillota bacterium]